MQLELLIFRTGAAHCDATLMLPSNPDNAHAEQLPLVIGDNEYFGMAVVKAGLLDRWDTDSS